MKMAVNQRQDDIDEQQQQSAAQHAPWQVQLLEEVFQTQKSQKRGESASHAKYPHKIPVEQGGLADENERHEHQQVFQTKQQDGIIPDATSCEHDGGHHQ